MEAKKVKAIGDTKKYGYLLREVLRSERNWWQCLKSLNNSEHPIELLKIVSGDCISQGSSEKQNRYVERYMREWPQDYRGEFHSLLSANRRPRKASGAVPVRPKSLGTCEGLRVLIPAWVWRPRTRSTDVPCASVSVSSPSHSLCLSLWLVQLESVRLPFPRFSHHLFSCPPPHWGYKSAVTTDLPDKDLDHRWPTSFFWLYSRVLNSVGVRWVNPWAVENPHITVDSRICFWQIQQTMAGKQYFSSLVGICGWECKNSFQSLADWIQQMQNLRKGRATFNF